MTKLIYLALVTISLFVGFKRLSFQNNLDVQVNQLTTSYLRNRGLTLMDVSQKLKKVSQSKREKLLINLYNKVHPNDWRSRQALLMLMTLYFENEWAFWDEVIQFRGTSQDEKFRIYKYGLSNSSVRISLKAHRSMLAKNYSRSTVESLVKFLASRDISAKELFAGIPDDKVVKGEQELICELFFKETGRGCEKR